MRYNTISNGSSIGILFEGFWESLGLFVRKKSTYEQIEMDSNEEAVRTNIKIFIELMNETDELKLIYLDDKE